MAVSLKDVARLAGVSIKTVSNVVNDYPLSVPTPGRGCAPRWRPGGSITSPLELSAARTGIVATGTVVVEAAAAHRPGQGRIDGDGPVPPGHPCQLQDLVVAAGRRQQFQVPLA